MAEQKNILKWIVVDLEKILHFLAEKLNDNESIKEILLSLGYDWDENSSALTPPPASAFESIKAYTDKSDDNIDIEAFATVAMDIIGISNAIEDAINIIKLTVNDGDNEALASEITDLLLQLSLIEYLKLRVKKTDSRYQSLPTLYAALGLPDLYQELSTTSKDIFGLKSIGLLFKKLFQSFNAESEEEAKFLSDFLYLFLGASSYLSEKLRPNLRSIYGFDPGPSSVSPIADQLSNRTLTIELSDKGIALGDSELSLTYYISIALKTAGQGGGPEVWLSGRGTSEIDLGNDWTLTISGEGIPEFDASLEIELKKQTEQIRWVIGSTKGTRLEIGSLSFSINGSVAEKDIDFNASISECAFVLAKGTDSFISKILPASGVTGNFDLGIGYSLKNGPYIDGGSGLSLLIPMHAILGSGKYNLTLNSFILRIKGNEAGDGADIENSIGFTVNLGGFSATIERIGLVHSLSFPDGVKKLWIADYSIDFKPPDGVGLSVNGGGFKGGGFLKFDFDNKEYFGAIELVYKELISLKAYGIITTRLPDGSDGFSLLIVITTEFPPWQLGLGFTLNGVGGLIGINRTAKLDVLIEGIKTNTFKSILFPEDVVANISRIISDVKQIFPVLDEHFLFCPMFKIGWGSPTIITLELGILIENRVADVKILGVLKAILPEERSPLLKLQVNFLGIIDFENGSISFDASLYDSKILTFTLTGDMAFRLSFNSPSFIISVGGFHPAFSEVPDDLKSMRRITISFYEGENARIISQNYFAITSNTVQFGNKTELFAGSSGGFNIYGYVGFDVLFRLSPFEFIADFSAGVSLRHGSSVMMSIHVSGRFSGPKPFDIRGEASVSFFFFSVSVPFNITLGEAVTALTEQIADVLKMLTDEINLNSNWKTEIPVNNKLHVSIRSVPESSMVVHPFGILTFSERLVPLEIEIKKFGNKLPKDASNFKIKVDNDKLKTEEAREQFAPANFFEMTDAQKLDRPSFEQMKSGFKITGSAQLKAPPHITKKNVDYEFSYLGKKRKIKPDKYKYPGIIFKANTKSAAASQSSLSHQNNRASMNAPEKVSIREEQYVIANISDMKLHSSEIVATNYTETLQYYNELIIRQPELKNKVQVLAEYELN